MYILLVDQISAFMKRPKTTTVIESITGAVLIGFGIKLAMEKAQH
jgi:threonine/homoserine/homoserine lactone efflux protein